MKNKLVSFILGYEASEGMLKSSRGQRVLGHTFTSLNISGKSTRITKRLQKSRPAMALQSLSRYLAYTSARVIGALMLSLGLTVLLTHLVAHYFSTLNENYLAEIVIGSVISFLAIPLLIAQGSVSIVLQENPISDAVFFDFLCIRRRHDTTLEYKMPLPITITIGILVGLLAFFIGCEIVIFAILGLLFLALSLASPEFSLIITLLLLPYLGLTGHSSIMLAFLVGITLIAFIRKVCLGKRVLHFEQYDALIIFFDIFVIISGALSGGESSLYTSLLIVILSFGYILTSNLLTNVRLCECAMNAIIYSSVPAGIYAIVQYLLGFGTDNYLDPSFVGVLGGRVSSTFTNPNIYAVFLIVALIFSFGAIFKAKTTFTKIFCIFATTVNLFAMIFTWTRGAWLAILIAAVALGLLYIKRAPGTLLTVAAVIPYLIYLIPHTVLDRFLSIFNSADTSVAYRFSIWRASVKMLSENFFTGVGMGTEAFMDSFLKYAEDGVSAPHSHNLFLELAAEGGIFMLLVFLAILFVRAKHVSEYRHYISHSTLKNPIATTVTATVGLIVFGMTDYIFYDMRMAFLFFILFGISSASLRLAKKENDDRLSYFGLDGDISASGIDVPIGK